jgi:hypothetical protein
VPQPLAAFDAPDNVKRLANALWDDASRLNDASAERLLGGLHVGRARTARI